MDRSASAIGRRGRLRVVTFVDFLSKGGGAEHIAYLIACGLNQERFESILCVSRWPPPANTHLVRGPWAEWAKNALTDLDEAGVRFLALERERKVDLPAWRRLERFLRREQVDVLHAHQHGANVWGTLIGRAARVPVIVAHEHSWSYEGQPFRRFVDRRVIAQGADRLIAVSRADRRRMGEIEHIDPSRTVFIPNGIAGVESASGRALREELGVDQATPVIVTVGSLYTVKAFDVLIRAAARLAESQPDTRVWIVGDGPERANLEALVAELGMGETVAFLGHRNDVAELLAASDVAVCCSYSEGSPLSVMEYMEAALPVVATDVGGLPDLITPNVNGLLVPRGDAGALAGALGELTRDPARRRVMGERARERRRAEFGIDLTVSRLEDLYVELYDARRARNRGR